MSKKSTELFLFLGMAIFNIALNVINELLIKIPYIRRISVGIVVIAILIAIYIYTHIFQWLFKFLRIILVVFLTILSYLNIFHRLKVIEDKLNGSENNQGLINDRRNEIDIVRNQLTKEEIGIIKKIGNIDGITITLEEFKSDLLSLLNDNYKVRQSLKKLVNLKVFYTFSGPLDICYIKLTEFGFEIACLYLDREYKRPA